MSRLVPSFLTRSAIASLAMASAVLATAPAMAAPISVTVNDLDLSTKAGKRELAGRIEKAAEAYCSGQRDTGSILTSPTCKAAVKEELTQKIAARNAPAARMAAAR